jgi:hypothetical protein
MRTTLSLEEDVIHRAREISEKTKTSFRHVVNEALRKGLDSIEPRKKIHPYVTPSRPMRLRPGKNLDNIHDLLAEIEGETHR